MMVVPVEVVPPVAYTKHKVQLRFLR